MKLQKLDCGGDWDDVDNDRVEKYVNLAANFNNVKYDAILETLNNNKMCRTGTDWYEKIRIKPAPIHRKPEDTVLKAKGEER